jgi:hypothetical protein
MAAKRRFGSPRPSPIAPLPRPHRWAWRRLVIAAIATTTALLAAGTATSRAATGSVYVDAKFNAAAGHDSFNGSFTGGSNVGLGYSVMPNLTNGADNTLIGRAALRANTQGFGNTASGYFALSANTSGDNNMASGNEALMSNTSGSANVAVGTQALANDTTGFGNIALGTAAGGNLTTGFDNIDIANAATSGESDTIRVGEQGVEGRTFLAGVSGTTIAGKGKPVVVNAHGQLGTASGASTLGNELATGGTVRGLKDHNRRQDQEIARQSREIAALKREVAKLSGG